MTGTIRHRGPDGEGYLLVRGADAVPMAGPDTPAAAGGVTWGPSRGIDPDARGTVVLGHRRLAIVDLGASGHQPMRRSDADAWVVFNGEIYNHVELRAELRRCGRDFAGSSDTEVLLAAYAQWGPGFLDRLVGMFALVLVDPSRRVVVLARDRFGVKPLYWWRSPDGALAVASEIKAFTVLPGFQAHLDGRRAYDFLAYGLLDHDDATLFDGVRQVTPGHVVRLSLSTGTMSTRRWWALRPAPAPPDPVPALRRAFDESVRIHLRSDVPLGFCLSGGIDSSAIVATAAAVQGADRPGRTAFTASSEDPSLDETRWARLVADATGTDLVLTEPDLATVEEVLPEVTWAMDSPFGSTSILAQRAVFAAAAAARVPVMLDGQGADEQLAGYVPYFAWLLAERLAVGDVAGFGREARLLQDQHPDQVARLAQMLAYLWLPRRLARAGGRLAGVEGQDTARWFDLARAGLDRAPDTPAEIGMATRTVAGLARSQLTASNLPALLHYEDRNSMTFSVESRVPFLDHRLVELTYSLPSAALIGDGQTKRVLRQAMRGRVPDAVLDRRDKIGFATAERAWMRSNPDRVALLADRAVAAADGLLRPSALSRAVAVAEGRRRFSFQTWRVISFGAWLERFAVEVDR